MSPMNCSEFSAIGQPADVDEQRVHLSRDSARCTRFHTLIVHRDEPTLIEFWNLQPDDDHDFMLMDPHWAVIMKVLLPALQKSSYVFTFHQKGLFNFSCTMRQPAMNGQSLVIPPVGR